MIIRLTVKSQEAKRKLQTIKEGLDVRALDRIAEREAFKGLAMLAAASPKRYFGQLQSGWRVSKTQEGGRMVSIPPDLRSPTGQRVVHILRWVNNGTANNGQGYIYPRKKFLYIPLNRSAALGWRPGLEHGVDYVLARRVRGIVGQHFVQPVIAKVRASFRESLRNYVTSLIHKGQ